MTNEHTARPTTMTDVDTTRPKTIYLYGPEEETLWCMNDNSDEEFPATAYIREDVHEALAAERDELERLAGAMGDTLDKAEAYIPELRKIMDQVGIEVNMRLEVDGEEIEVGQDIINRIKRDLAALAKLKARP